MPLRHLSPKLPPEARDAINAAFDAMSTCHAEMAASNEKVVEKLAGVARTLGWPAPIVDGITIQIRSVTKMHVQMIEHLMDACEAQVNSASPMGDFPAEFLSKMQAWPGLASPGAWPSADSFQSMSKNPVEFWTQLGEQWQKNWATMASEWAKMSKPR